jgi:hypothetical protein
MLRFAYDGVTESIFKNVGPTGGYGGATTGKYELAWDFVSIDFANTAAVASNANVGINIRDTVAAGSPTRIGFRIQYNGAADELRLQLADDNGASQTMKAFPGSSLSNLSVRVEMDCDKAGASGSVQMFYTLDGGVEVALTQAGVLAAGSVLSEYRLVVQTINGGTGWQLGDDVFTDNLKYSAIPALTKPPNFGSPIVDYQMNDTAGTLLAGLAQSGSDGGHVAGTDPFIATDGAGNLVWSVVTSTAYRNHAMDTTFTSGLHRVEFLLGDWDMTTSTDGSGVRIGLYDETGTNGVFFGIDVNTNNAGIRMRSAVTSGGSGQVIIPGYDTGTGVVLRIDANMDADAYVASWRYTTDTDFSTVGSGSLGGLANLQIIKFITLGTGWGAGDFVMMDYVTYTTTSDEQPWNPASRYAQWLSAYPGLGASTNQTDDFDGDLFNNVYEYGLGGDPTVAYSVNIPEFGDTMVDGGTNYILYVYAKLKDNSSANRGLSYYLQTTDNLVYTPWTNAFYEVVGTGSLDADFNAVTNRVSTDAANARFIKLKIDLNL